MSTRRWSTCAGGRRSPPGSARSLRVNINKRATSPASARAAAPSSISVWLRQLHWCHSPAPAGATMLVRSRHAWRCCGGSESNRVHSSLTQHYSNLSTGARASSIVRPVSRNHSLWGGSGQPKPGVTRKPTERIRRLEQCGEPNSRPAGKHPACGFCRRYTMPPSGMQRLPHWVACSPPCSSLRTSGSWSLRAPIPGATGPLGGERRVPLWRAPRSRGAGAA